MFKVENMMRLVCIMELNERKTFQVAISPAVGGPAGG
jgi:hypothetical protein